MTLEVVPLRLSDIILIALAVSVVVIMAKRVFGSVARRVNSD